MSNGFFGFISIIMSMLLTFSGFNFAKEEKKMPDVTEETIVFEGLEVPEGLLEGEEFKMYIAHSAVKSSYIVEEQTGDELNDATYMRNMYTEDYLGVDLIFEASTLPTDGQSQQQEASKIRTLIQSGDDTYHAIVNVQHTGMPALIQEGYFFDWNEMPYVNLDNDWWNGNVIRDICFGNKIYCMTGDYNLASFSNTECLIFNKDLCDELELEYPYQMVKDGTWTHDAFVQYIKAATYDLNGDGKMDRDHDQYGFGGWKYEQLPALYAAYGGQTLVKDENNLPVLNVYNERTYTVIDKMLEVFACEGAFFEGSMWGVDDRMFNEGRLLFNDSFISSVPGSRSIEDFEVGFIPYPKLNEEQPEYYSRTANISCLTYIPVTNAYLAKTGAVLETLAYFGNKYVLPTYFDVILTIKSTRDFESEEMIPIIRNSARFMDCVIGFDGSAIVSAGGPNTLNSLVAQNRDVWNQKLAQLIAIYE